MEVATRGGMSLDRMSSIESVRTDRYSGRTLAALERGLEWETGSVRAILAGGEPTPAERHPPAAKRRPDVDMAELVARLEADPELARMVAEIVRRAFRPPDPGSAADQQDIA